MEYASMFKALKYHLKRRLRGVEWGFQEIAAEVTNRPKPGLYDTHQYIRAFPYPNKSISTVTSSSIKASALWIPPLSRHKDSSALSKMESLRNDNESRRPDSSLEKELSTDHATIADDTSRRCFSGGVAFRGGRGRGHVNCNDTRRRGFQADLGIDFIDRRSGHTFQDIIRLASHKLV